MKYCSRCRSQPRPVGQTAARGRAHRRTRSLPPARWRSGSSQNLETVQRAAKSGRLPARRIGKEWRFLRDLVGRGARAEAPARRARTDDLFPRSPFETHDGHRARPGWTPRRRRASCARKEWTVRSEANQGRLPGWREGQRWRFSREELIEHMRATSRRTGSATTGGAPHASAPCRWAGAAWLSPASPAPTACASSSTPSRCSTSSARRSAASSASRRSPTSSGSRRSTPTSSCATSRRRGSSCAGRSRAPGGSGSGWPQLGATRSPRCALGGVPPAAAALQEATGLAG